MQNFSHNFDFLVYLQLYTHKIIESNNVITQNIPVFYIVGINVFDNITFYTFCAFVHSLVIVLSLIISWFAKC